MVLWPEPDVISSDTADCEHTLPPRKLYMFDCIFISLESGCYDHVLSP